MQFPSRYIPNVFHSLIFAEAIATVVTQSLTIQRSARSMVTLDWIALVLFGIIIPFLFAVVSRNGFTPKVTKIINSWLLAIESLLLSSLLLFFPAYIVPGDYILIINDDLVRITGTPLQCAILGLALITTLHSIINIPSTLNLDARTRLHTLLIGMVTGTLISGIGLAMAAYFGWTMFVVPILLILFILNGMDLFISQRIYNGVKYNGVKSEVTQTQKTTSENILESEVRNMKYGFPILWSSTLFIIIPFLLFSMNFQRGRYAIGYYPVLLYIGTVLLGFLIIFSIIRKRCMVKDRNKFKLSERNLLILMFMAVGLCGGLNIIPLIVMKIDSTLIIESFFKSSLYLMLGIIITLVGFIAISFALTNLSYANQQVIQSEPIINKNSQRKGFNIAFGSMMLILIVAIGLWQGTSMIFSWSFADSDPFLITLILNVVGWFFYCISGLVHKIEKLREKRIKKGIE